MERNDHSGYPVKWFKDQNTARQFYECAICLEVVKDAVQVRCGHQFCALCIDDILRADPRCPTCRIEISDAMVFEDQAVRRLIKQLEVNCCNEGCTWTGCLSSLLQGHQNNCNFLIQCDDNNAQKLKVEELEKKHDTLMLDVCLFKEKHQQDITALKLKVAATLIAKKYDKTNYKMVINYFISKGSLDNECLMLFRLCNKRCNSVSKYYYSQHEQDIKELNFKHEEDIKELKLKHEKEKQDIRDLQLKHKQEFQQDNKDLKFKHEQDFNELKLKLQQMEELWQLKVEEKELCKEEMPQKSSNLSFLPIGINDELLKLLRADQLEIETVFAQIEKNFKQEERKEAQFINWLVTVVAQSCIINREKAGPDCCKDKLKARKDILRKYLDNDITLELEALFALQEIYVKYNKPAAMLSHFFNTLYDEEVVTEEAFMKWKQDESPSRQEAKGPALQATALFFKRLQSATVEKKESAKVLSGVQGKSQGFNRTGRHPQQNQRYRFSPIPNEPLQRNQHGFPVQNVMMPGQRQGSFVPGHAIAMAQRPIRGRVYPSSPQGHSPMQGYIPQQNMQYQFMGQDRYGQPVMRPAYIPNVQQANRMQATSAPFQAQYIQQQPSIPTTNANKPKPKRASKIVKRDPKNHFKDITDQVLSNFAAIDRSVSSPLLGTFSNNNNDNTDDTHVNQSSPTLGERTEKLKMTIEPQKEPAKVVLLRADGETTKSEKREVKKKTAGVVHPITTSNALAESSYIQTQFAAQVAARVGEERTQVNEEEELD